MNKESRRLAVVAVVLLLLAVGVKFSWDWISPVQVEPRVGASAAIVPEDAVKPSTAPETSMDTTGAAAARSGLGVATAAVDEVGPLPVAELAAAEPASRLRVGLDSEAVHFNEAVLLFYTADAYQSFLEHAGFAVTGKIPEIFALRVRAATAQEIDVMIDTAFPQPELALFNADLNWKMPLVQSLSATGSTSARFYDVREIIGITRLYPVSPETGWGETNADPGAGMTLALLDTGVEENTAPLRGRFASLDVGWGIRPDDRNGSALAVMAAGTFDLARGYKGISSAIGVLGVRVTAADGFSDVFSVAQAIVDSVNAGASVVVVSPTSPYPALVLNRAVNYARTKPRVAVVAARLEDLKPSWPAVVPGVIPVTAVDDMAAPINADGSTARIVRAPPIVVPTVPGPDLATLWVRIDTGPASATAVGAAMAAALGKFPGSTADEIWAAMRQSVVDAGRSTEIIGPVGQGFSLLYVPWVADPADVAETPGETVALQIPTGPATPSRTPTQIGRAHV